jgi:hypothetical protein
MTRKLALNILDLTKPPIYNIEENAYEVTFERDLFLLILRDGN